MLILQVHKYFKTDIMTDQTGSGAYQLPIQSVPRAPSSGVKRSGFGVDYSLPCTTEVKNVETITLPLFYHFDGDEGFGFLIHAFSIVKGARGSVVG